MARDHWKVNTGEILVQRNEFYTEEILKKCRLIEQTKTTRYGDCVVCFLFAKGKSEGVAKWEAKGKKSQWNKASGFSFLPKTPSPAR